MELVDLINMLMNEHGLTEEEAVKIAAAKVKAARGSNLQRVNQNNFPVSAQQYANGVDYGEETPQQAKERWMQQEMEDPNGIYGGGATAGGVFGDGVVSLDHHDPAAFQRQLNMHAQLTNLQTQREMLNVMNDMRAKLQGEAPRELPRPPQRELHDARGIRRLLGSKKRGSGR